MSRPVHPCLRDMDVSQWTSRSSSSGRSVASYQFAITPSTVCRAHVLRTGRRWASFSKRLRRAASPVELGREWTPAAPAEYRPRRHMTWPSTSEMLAAGTGHPLLLTATAIQIIDSRLAGVLKLSRLTGRGDILQSLV